MKDIIIIVFHDIVPGLEESVRKVTKFQRETKSKFNYEEFVKDWDQGGYGIGIIFV